MMGMVERFGREKIPKIKSPQWKKKKFPGIQKKKKLKGGKTKGEKKKKKKPKNPFFFFVF